ncbi:TolC family outer membrane protein [Sphingomonas sp. KR1UV-12]|uniref:TolC family outer membrane protein n=1 Tax=Sphingomonas aurea TaxID=3063994 RepID=A0ABT9ENA3_9SPHN|nr:TolC family outer membrane protein [Sphingomonas sp. KR1UV-12]MDP1028442.1 TolC family outer membrane protein [Sphingomonas sp. KR1UV-12]
MNRWLAAAATLLLAAPAPAETLGEAIAAAYRTNPQLAAARARQEALAETPEQARALGRPTVSASGGAGYDELGAGRAASAAATVSLPIWTGGRVSSAVRAASGDVLAGAEGLRDTEAAILEGVVIAYADLLYNQQAVEVARVGIERLDRQVAEAQSRFGLGQATRTDVAQLEAQRASVVANLADAEGALATAAAAYRAAVGQDAGTLSAAITPPDTLPADRDGARRAAEAANPLLLQQRRLVEASAARIDQARADRAPAIDLAGGYGRGGRFVDGDWRGFETAASVGLALRVPLLTGGLVPSRIRQAEASYRAERFQADAAAREAVRSADAAWASLAAAQARGRAATEGLAAADLALQGVRAEYGFGLRSTIDILVADQSLRAAQLALAAARSDTLVAQAALLRATGRLDAVAYAVTRYGAVLPRTISSWRSVTCRTGLSTLRRISTSSSTVRRPIIALGWATVVNPGWK